jgi:hypothetical protein
LFFSAAILEDLARSDDVVWDYAVRARLRCFQFTVKNKHDIKARYLADLVTRLAALGVEVAELEVWMVVPRGQSGNFSWSKHRDLVPHPAVSKLWDGEPRIVEFGAK